MSEEQKINLVKQNTEKLKNMDDGQLKNMVDMMKNNKDHLKQMYKAQGMEMSDEQIEQISKMMSPEMIKNASNMLASNPELVN